MAFWSYHRDVYHREQGVRHGLHAVSEEVQWLLLSTFVFALAVLLFASRAF
jgi:hypothetical protein